MLPVLIVLCAAATGALGQGTPLLLRVIKSENSEVKDRLYSGSYSRHTTAETLTYAIEVTNAGQTPVSGVEIKWAILLKPRGSGKQQLVEGTQTLNLARAEKQTVETTPVQTRQAWRSSVSSYNYDVLEEVGHVVEVIVAGKTVASETKPMDVKQKIEIERRAAESKPPLTGSSSIKKPRRHTTP